MGNILIKQARSTGPGSVSIIRSKEKDSGKLDGKALERNLMVQQHMYKKRSGMVILKTINSHLMLIVNM